MDNSNNYKKQIDSIFEEYKSTWKKYRIFYIFIPIIWVVLYVLGNVANLHFLFLTIPFSCYVIICVSLYIYSRKTGLKKHIKGINSYDEQKYKKAIDSIDDQMILAYYILHKEMRFRGYEYAIKKVNQPLPLFALASHIDYTEHIHELDYFWKLVFNRLCDDLQYLTQIIYAIFNKNNDFSAYHCRRILDLIDKIPDQIILLNVFKKCKDKEELLLLNRNRIPEFDYGWIKKACLEIEDKIFKRIIDDELRLELLPGYSNCYESIMWYSQYCRKHIELSDLAEPIKTVYNNTNYEGDAYNSYQLAVNTLIQTACDKPQKLLPVWDHIKDVIENAKICWDYYDPLHAVQNKQVLTKSANLKFSSRPSGI